MRVPIVVALALLTVPLSACLGIEDDTRPTQTSPTGPKPYETYDAALPAKNNNKLWLHSDGDEGTMTTSQAGPDDPVTGRVDPSSAQTWIPFTLAPTPNRQLNLTGGAALAVIEFETGGAVGLPPDVTARVYFGDALVGSGTAEGMLGGAAQISINLPAVVPPGADVRMEVCICGQQATLIPSYTIHTDGRSSLELPVVTPVYVPQPAAGGATTSVNAQRLEGEIETVREGNRWVARQAVTFTNALDIDEASLEFSTGAGSIDVSTWDDGGYEILAALEGRGETEQEALDNLASLRVDQGQPDEDGGLLYARATTADGEWQDRSAALRARVPDAWSAPSTELTTGAGSVDVAGIRGQEVRVETGAGSVDVSDMVVDSLSLDTSSGSIDVAATAAETAVLYSGSGSIDLEDVDTEDLDVETGSGGIEAVATRVVDASFESGAGSIDLALEPTASGTVTLHSGAGTVDVEVPDGSSYGYDATATSGVGGTSIDLPDTEPVGDQSEYAKHERTRNYDAKSVRVELSAESGAGSVAIRGG